MRAQRRVLAAVIAATATVGLVGCGGDDEDTKASATSTAAGSASKATSVDVGNGLTVDTEGKPPKIALFAAGSSNSYLIAQNDQARKSAKEAGLELDVFDGKFDPANQFKQMQTALVSGKYNAWIVQAIDGQQTCKLLTEKAPEKGIVVSAIVVALCDRAENEGEELWAPGTLNFIGGNETVEAWKEIWKKAIADNPGPQKVGVMVGAPLNSITIAYMAAMKELLPDDWEVVDTVNTDYSIPDSQAKGQTLIQANPDMTILMSAYTNITKGGISALKAAGRLDDVKIYDGGGTVTGVDYVKKGVTQATTARYSRSPIKASVQSLVDAFAGEQVPRFVPNDGHAPEPGRDPDAALFVVTKDNADDYKPEND